MTGSALRMPAAAAGIGFLVGLAVWFLAWTLLLPAGGVDDSLAQARELGLTSLTIREGYDKGQELRAWLLSLVLVPGGLWLGWKLATRSRPGNRGRQDGRESTGGTARSASESAGRTRLGKRMAWLFVAISALVVTLRPGVLHGPNPWGAFGLLGEEGVYLGTIQALRSGRLLYADLHFPYGPLLIQPLQLWLAIFGDTVVAARGYVLLLHGVGVLGMAVTIRLALGRSLLAHWTAAAGAVALALLAPTELPNLNSALIRPVLAFLPVGMALAGIRWWRTLTSDAGAKVTPFHLAGVLVAIAVLVSVDVGAAAAAGTLLALVTARLGRSPWLQTGAALLLVLVVALAPLAFAGTLGAFVQQSVDTIRLGSLGYQALPYPDPLGLFANADGLRGSYPSDGLDLATATWSIVPPLVIWLALGVGAAGSPRTAPRRPGLPLLCTALTAALLFRAALGRSDLYHLWFYGVVPVLLLLCLLNARLWQVLSGPVRWAVAALSVALVAALLCLQPLDEVRFKQAGATETELTLSRTGTLRLDSATAAHLEAVLSWAERIDRKEGIYFYPSEAMLYFLADRPLPVGYLWAYDAPTRPMQERLIAELNSTRPRWLVHSQLTFPIDWIPEAELLPQLSLYIQSNYETVGILPGATLMRRIQR